MTRPPLTVRKAATSVEVDPLTALVLRVRAAIAWDGIHLGGAGDDWIAFSGAVTARGSDIARPLRWNVLERSITRAREQGSYLQGTR